MVLQERQTSNRISKLSYIHGTSDIPLLHDTVGDRLRMAVEEVPNKIMVIFKECGIRKTYQQVFDEARQFAASLIKLGHQKGDRIAVWAPNYYEWVVAKYAAAFAGFTIAAIDPFYKAEELKYVLQKVEVSAIIAPRKDAINDYYEILGQVVPEILSGKKGIGKVECQELPNLKNIILFKTDDEEFHGVWNFERLMVMNNDFSILDDIESDIRVDDPFIIIFTSGTTGQPKAATLTHHNAINNAYFIGLRAKFRQSSEIICVPNRLCGIAALICGLLSSLCHYETVVFPSPVFNAKAVLHAINDEKPTMLYGFPTMFIDILNQPEIETTDLSSLHGGMIGGAPVPSILCRKIIDKLGMANFINTFGSTEIGLTVMSYPDDEENCKVHSVGHALPHVELAVMDNKSGKFVNRGEKGELVIRGYSVMQAYWNDEDKTKEVIGKDRWYHTGDVCSMNFDGSITIDGRYKDMIIRAGLNLYPAEIEQYIAKHPFIADVHVIGVPDETNGEELCAWIRLKEGNSITSTELIDFLKHLISPAKIPRYIFFKSKHEFPLASSGKIKKYELQQLSIKELNLENVVSHYQ